MTEEGFCFDESQWGDMPLLSAGNLASVFMTRHIEKHDLWYAERMAPPGRWCYFTTRTPEISY